MVWYLNILVVGARITERNSAIHTYPNTHVKTCQTLQFTFHAKVLPLIGVNPLLRQLQFQLLYHFIEVAELNRERDPDGSHALQQ